MDTTGCKTLHPTSPPFDFFLATRRAVRKCVRVQLAVADAVRRPGQVMLLVCSPLTNKKTHEHRCCSLLFFILGGKIQCSLANRRCEEQPTTACSLTKINSPMVGGVATAFRRRAASGWSSTDVQFAFYFLAEDAVPLLFAVVHSCAMGFTCNYFFENSKFSLFCF